MFIKSSNNHKSINKDHLSIEVPNFVVISGLNGSGKTHLLEAVSSSAISLIENEATLSPIKLVDHNTLSPINGTIVSIENLRQQTQSSYEVYQSYTNQKKQWVHLTLDSSSLNENFRKLCRTIADRAKKDVEKLSIDDFYLYYPIEDGLNNVDIFQQNFSFLFKRYQVNRINNRFNQFLAQQSSDSNVEFIEDDEFLKLYGEPPWDFVNRIIEAAHLDYRIKPPAPDRDTPYELKLVNNFNGAEILFSDLSSGEKVLMSLALSLYNSRFDREFPAVLLMDEPDAHLHPSMTKSFLEVIQNVFVIEKKVKVIITTHSPSTVALAPEEALHIMNKIAPRIEKVSKDKALSILTSGVPTLSINYENRRQVFVESKYDVFFYEKIYEKLKDKLIPEISINFISSGVSGIGNCGAVKEVVSGLRRHGNKSIYGIIDWDLTNTSDEMVKVLGENKRYSIENYIFDPILLTMFLIRERFLDNAKIGLNDKEAFFDFIHFDSSKLQEIVKYVVEEVRQKAGNPSDTDFKECEYVSGHKISLPSWFLQIQGHALENHIKSIFPQFGRYRREGELKQEIITKVIDDLPGFIPKDLLDLLSSIQNFS